MNEDNSLELNKLLEEQKNILRKTSGCMHIYMLKEHHTKPKHNSNLSKAILHQFSTTNIKRFCELATEDLLEEDRLLFKKLSLETKGNRIPRLENYVFRPFSYAELINTLLFLRYEKALDLYDCSIYLNGSNYDLLLSSMPYEPVYVNNVLHIYDIPILTDKNHGTSKCLSNNLVYILNNKMKAKVYNDKVTCSVVNNESTIESYRAVVANLTPFKFFTIKV